MTLRRVAWFLLWLSWGASGCDGDIGEMPDGAERSIAGQAGSGSSTQPTQAECQSQTPSPGPSPLRRLTKAEYDNTVGALLGPAEPAAEGSPSAAFPKEELLLGFPNNAAQQSATTLLIESYESAARKLAATAMQNLPSVMGCNPAAMGEDKCTTSFVTTFGAKAYRRPLTQAEVDRFIAFYGKNKQAYGFATAVRMTLEALLQSPNLLYRVEALGPQPVTRVTGYEMATRMSYLLWASTPDPSLLDAAAAGALDKPEGVEAQAARMLSDPKAQQAALPLFTYWLDLERVTKSQKSPQIFPRFTPKIGALLREESERFVSDVFSNGNLSTLLRGSYTFMNADLASYYGLPGPSGAAFERVALPPSRYTGFLTQAGVQAGNAKVDQTSPVTRGLFVRERLLCAPPSPPPNTVNVNPPALDPSLTTRDRFAAHRTVPLCAGCHSLMDPIGFGFEHFDGQGLWRENENGLPIDSTGEFVDTQDLDGKFNGVIELATKLSESSQVADCAVRQWFRYGYGRAEFDSDACTLVELNQAFAKGGGNWKALAQALTRTDAFVYRTNESGGAQ